MQPQSSRASLATEPQFVADPKKEEQKGVPVPYRGSNSDGSSLSMSAVALEHLLRESIAPAYGHQMQDIPEPFSINRTEGDE